MQVWKTDHIQDLMKQMTSTCLNSTPHIRLQAICTSTAKPEELYNLKHGELFVTINKGPVKLATANSTRDLDTGDYCLLVEGDEFSFYTDTNDKAVLIFCWSPGDGGCTKCQN